MRSVHCPHCGQASTLPDPWPHDSFRCGNCNVTVHLGGPPERVVPPVEHPPPYHQPRQVGHTRSAFGTMFGASLGCFAAVVVILAVLLFLAIRMTD